MVLYDIYERAEIRRYKSSLVSRAAFFQLVCIVITFIAPLLVAYRSYGFWLKESHHTEQPNVKYTYNTLLILHTVSSSSSSSSGQQYAWSTSNNLNILQHQQLLAPVIQVREVDEYLDGKRDRLLLRLKAPVTGGVTAVKLLLFFDYSLSEIYPLQMQSMAVIDYSSSLPAASVSMIGELNFKQKIPIGGSVYASNAYNNSVINFNSILSEDYRLSTVFASYQSRNFSTKLENTIFSWQTANSDAGAFELNATINYNPVRFVYIPNYWRVMMYAWVQYIPILILFLFVFDRIKVFTLQNQIIGCYMLRPLIDCKLKKEIM